MKKFIILILCLFLLSSCNYNDSDNINNNVQNEIPEKINPEGLDVDDSSVTTLNLDEYLMRDDVVYIDLRYYSWILKDGYIPGFTFIPYYDYMVSRTGRNSFFRQEKIDGIIDGNVGSYKPLYKESFFMLKKHFPLDKKIFLISQSGLESYYMGALLTQFGYKPENIYNIGGVTNRAGNIPPYRFVGTNFVKGNPNVPSNDDSFKIDFNKLDLHFIEE